MSSPFLSFILPTIRSIGSVGDILFDIFNCDYKNMEIIIIYDSPQNSSDHIKRFIADNNRNNVAVNIIENKKNLGRGESRNIGIEASKGEYLCFIDDDDNLSLDWLGDLLVKSERPDIIFLSFEDSIGALDNNDFLKNFNSYSL